MERTMTAQLQVDIANGVATIVLDRQAQYNALTATLLEALARTFAELERNAEVRTIVLTGAGKGFCAGQSLDDPAIATGRSSRRSTASQPAPAWGSRWRAICGSRAKPHPSRRRS
jgi:enoyl-CoA hydratase/carnithine racemase